MARETWRGPWTRFVRLSWPAPQGETVGLSSCRQDWAHETPFEADDAPSFRLEAPRRERHLVLSDRYAVALVLGKGGKAEQLYGDVVRAIVRKKGPVVRSAIFRGERHGHTGVLFEFLELVRIDDVAQVAGDHGPRLLTRRQS